MNTELNKALWRFSLDSKRWHSLKKYAQKIDDQSQLIFDESVEKITDALPIYNIFLYKKYEKKYNKLIHHYNFIAEVTNDARQNMIDDINDLIDLFQQETPDNVELINAYKRLLNEMED
ncbi:MAG: hypothetical protein LKI22_07235 [Liquorilactobacillus nagelii]|jgi:hypothetical protein|uniref:hypothetical protein n=1 Tax=Liquorilactobacillus nagelii TaxID=82688 RepID=UPI002431E3F4|nr:hypothetical protein [Liquorilactobacillus nagelii]MCI1633699.1 hypothetical protein [Liquorilactobacillus nagelii]